MGQNYFKSLCAVGFQGLLMLVCVGIYAVLIQGMLMMIALMLPCFFFAMYERDGLPFEKVLRNIARSNFLWPRTRLYKTDNFYACLSKPRMKRKQQHTRFSRLAVEADFQQPAFSMPQNSTSGQLGPKSNPGGKLRQESEQARPSERLRHEDDTPPPTDEAGVGPADKKTERDSKRFEKTKLKAEKSGAKLDMAQEKLAAQKLYKPPSPLKTVSRAARFHTWHYVHRKIHEIEHENVGVEAAHKTELAGEGVIRGDTSFIKRQVRTHPARLVRKWEQRDVKANAEYNMRGVLVNYPVFFFFVIDIAVYRGGGQAFALVAFRPVMSGDFSACVRNIPLVETSRKIEIISKPLAVSSPGRRKRVPLTPSSVKWQGFLKPFFRA